MKRFVLLIALISTSFLLSAQISEQSLSMSNGVNNALVFELANTEERLVLKWWKTYMRDFDGKPKKVKGSSELLSNDADIPGIGAGNTVDVYALIEESGEDVVLTTWFDLGGAYLNSAAHGDRYVEGEKFLMRFGLFVTKEMIKIEFEEEKKRLSELEKDLDKLKRDNDRLHDIIAEAERAIEEAKADIETNVQEQEGKVKDIDAQQKVVENVKAKLDEF